MTPTRVEVLTMPWGGRGVVFTLADPVYHLLVLRKEFSVKDQRAEHSMYHYVLTKFCGV